MSGYQVIGAEEDLPVSNFHDIYPTINPEQFYNAQTFKDQVVLITGASRGIGREAALTYARAGASLVLVSRKQETLDETKDIILAELPSARIVTYPADVRDPEAARGAVRTAVDTYGKLDILVANAETPALIQGDPTGWWEVLEVSIRGAYNFIHFSVPELLKTKGKIIAVTSVAAQLRPPTMSDYSTAKFALNRLIEFLAVEYPDLKVFSVHPGTIETEVTKARNIPGVDTLRLPAAVFLYLTAGKADYLSGRYVSATWDLEEVERDWKSKIVEQHGLVAKLYIPK
ncbi:NAD-P-binding protein [Gloeopeniophorella convolvens]|nr:NAD-P-binding protein [Gloeopeniophorella convolvens]